MNLKIKKNIYYALIQRLLIVLLLFTLSRIIFYFFNTKYFSNISFGEFISIFLGGLRFDISAILMVNLPFIFLMSIPIPFREHKIYRIICKAIFIIFNTIALLFNSIDFMYFKFIFKRTTADFFNLFTMGDDMANTLPQMIKDFWYVAVIWILMIALMIYLYNRTRSEERSAKSEKGIKYYFYNFLVFIAIIIITVIGIRGGFQLKPINIIAASRYANANNIPLVLNTPFTMIKTMKQAPLEKVKYFNDENELKKIYNPVKNESVLLSPQSTDFKKLNIVIIILESFSKEHIGVLSNRQPATGNQKSLTPFLDSLIRESLVFPNAFANGRKSIEGIPAVLASIPSLMNNPYISSAFAGDKIASLGNLLKKEGYITSFYHGGTNGTMGFDNFAKIAGFDNYFGRTEYNNDKDFDGNWGIWDEPYLQYFAKSLNKTNQPFISTIFTLSSHHPYFIPAKYKDKFKYGNPLQRSISYTDYALREFFATASKMSWFDNTLFVFTADHTSQVLDEKLNNRLGAYEVPVFYYQHNSNLKGIDSSITQQIDIMPSVLDYINYKKSYIAFGNSVFENATKNPELFKNKIYKFAINYLSDTYEIIDKNYVLQYDGKHFLALYDRNADPELKHSFLNKPVGDLDKINDLELLLKAIIQSYNERIIDNKLTINE